MHLPEMAVHLIKEFRTGVSDPIGRMNAARIATIGAAVATPETDADREARLNALQSVA